MTASSSSNSSWVALRGIALAAARVFFGAVFIYAASTKMIDMRLFAEEVANYHVVPPSLVPLAAASVVGVELVAGAMLVLGLRARAAAGVLSVLLVVFIAALSQALLRDIDLRCGCFGTAEPATWGTVVRDAALLLVGAPLVLAGPGRFALDRGASRGDRAR